MSRATKTKRKRYLNPLFDDRGYPDRQNDWEDILPRGQSGPLIRKRKYAAPDTTSIDPAFGEEYDPVKHLDHLTSDLNIAHLSITHRERLTSLVNKYYRVFSKAGVITPVKDYVCDIDTGSTIPICC